MQNSTQSQTNAQRHHILDASQTLLKAAEQANWEDLSAHAAERDRLIRAYFSKPLTVENALQVHDQIIELLAVDDKILGLARMEQEKTLPTLRKLAQGKKAVNAYHQHNQ